MGTVRITAQSRGRVIGRSLSRRLALALMLVFIPAATLVVFISPRMPDSERVLELVAGLLTGSIGFALLAALLVVRLLTGRLRILADAIDRFRRDGFDRPVEFPWARSGGDEIDRLAVGFEQMAHQMSRQLARLQAHDAQRRELLANVSHDLRTPVALMQGYLDTLLLHQGDLTPAEARNYLEVAVRHAGRLGQLVADLFELSKLDGIDQSVSAEVFPLTELVQDVAQKFALGATGRDVRIETRLDGETPPVRGDIRLVERALENLIANALRHTPAGGLVEVDLQGHDSRVHVRVRDTGCGIAREDLPHVFERYFRAPRVESATAGGAAPSVADPVTDRDHLGLGLAITRRIVTLHGGEIRVASTPGQGTTFAFDLPAASGA